MHICGYVHMRPGAHCVQKENTGAEVIIIFSDFLQWMYITFDSVLGREEEVTEKGCLPGVVMQLGEISPNVL